MSDIRYHGADRTRATCVLRMQCIGAWVPDICQVYALVYNGSNST